MRSVFRALGKAKMDRVLRLCVVESKEKEFQDVLQTPGIDRGSAPFSIMCICTSCKMGLVYTFIRVIYAR